MEKHWTSLVSQYFGAFAGHPFPSRVQSFINHAYVNLLGLQMDEFAPPSTFPTLNALFTRELKRTRLIDPAPESVISPIDGMVTQCGAMEATTLLQIKGMPYALEALLGESYASKAGELEGGVYANFYLSPKDYHRYHAPMDLQVLSALHLPGKLYPVNLPSLKKRRNLFIENERVVLECRDRWKRRFFLVFVGALNVGKMRFDFDRRIQTNADAQRSSFYNYDGQSLWLKKGRQIGMFEMGSTVVLIAPRVMLELSVKTGENVRFSQVIGRLNLPKTAK